MSNRPLSTPIRRALEAMPTESPSFGNRADALAEYDALLAEVAAYRAVLRRVAHEAPDHFAFKSAARAVLTDGS